MLTIAMLIRGSLSPVTMVTGDLMANCVEDCNCWN